MEAFKPELDRRHRYAVGLRIEGGGFTPLKSYASEEQLEEGYKDLYLFSQERDLHRPLAVQKQDECEWNRAICLTLPEVMVKMIKQDPKYKDLV